MAKLWSWKVVSVDPVKDIIAFIMHLQQNTPHNRCMITKCDIMSLKNRACSNVYQAMPLEAISEDDWLHTDVGRHNNVDRSNYVTELGHNAWRDVRRFEPNSVKLAFHSVEALCALEIFLLMTHDEKENHSCVF